MRALSGVAAIACLTAVAGCRPQATTPAASDGAQPFAMPQTLHASRDSVDLCPERAACAEALPDWQARCESETADPGATGETCYVAGFMTRIVAGPAFLGDPVALTEETLRLHDRACEHGHADGCAWAASLRLFTGDALERARADARKGCDAGSGAACVMLARAMLPDPETRAVGEASLITMCEDRSLGQACGDLAFAYLSGDYLRESVNDALAYAQRGCALDEGSSCAALATMVYSFASLADLGPEALEAAAKGCERGFDTACATASVLYDRYRDTPGVEDWDDARMVDSLERGCTELEGSSACVLLGIVYEGGVGETISANPQRAAELHQWACEHGDDEGCLRLGVVLSNSTDPEQAEYGRRLVVELCEEGYGPACQLLR